jgi:DNA (cytosine-5)-methyltransferase 1
VLVGGVYTGVSEAYNRGVMEDYARTLKTDGKNGVYLSDGNTQGMSLAHDGDGIRLSFPGSTSARGRVQKGVAGTLSTVQEGGVMVSGRIRRFTPKEQFRLQGFCGEPPFDDMLYHKAAAVCSESQLYKQSGNSVTVPVIRHIAERITKVMECAE